MKISPKGQGDKGKEKKKKQFSIKPKDGEKLEKKAVPQMGEAQTYSKKLAKFQNQAADKAKIKKRLKKITKFSIIGLLIAVVGITYLIQKPKIDKLFKAKAGPGGIMAVEENKNEKYGFDFRNFTVKRDVTKDRQGIVKTLKSYKISDYKIEELKLKLVEASGYNELEAGKTLTLLSDPSEQTPKHLIYEATVNSYMILNLEDPVGIEMVEEDLAVVVKSAACLIQSSLHKSILDNGLRYELIFKMEQALSSRVDFYHLNPGDRFKLVYEEKYLDNKLVGIGNLLGIYFQTNGEDIYGFQFENEGKEVYVDDSGRPLKTSFILAPVKYARISSYFGNRYHPVLKKSKAHKGTDYAAPEGTPIIAVADGIVLNAQFSQYNGNYVKLKHNDTYKTQYLHMSKFAEGIKPGTAVKQGQTIGYVGSTGLSTGPHVCFRFWKNDVQVDHLKERLPQAEALGVEHIPDFVTHRDSVLALLEEIQVYN